MQSILSKQSSPIFQMLGQLLVKAHQLRKRDHLLHSGVPSSVVLMINLRKIMLVPEILFTHTNNSSSNSSR